jgi:hypothetical protein
MLYFEIVYLAYTPICFVRLVLETFHFQLIFVEVLRQILRCFF